MIFCVFWKTQKAPKQNEIYLLSQFSGINPWDLFWSISFSLLPLSVSVSLCLSPTLLCLFLSLGIISLHNCVSCLFHLTESGNVKAVTEPFYFHIFYFISVCIFPSFFFFFCQYFFILECFHFYQSSIQNVKQFMLFEFYFLPTLVKIDQWKKSFPDYDRSTSNYITGSI